MSRCIEIAQNGLGITAPNPMVGAVIVHDGKIIGEGFTSAFGKSHAEVNAIQSVSNKTLLKEATLYVTLEPCSHYGKTPPCADLIVRHQIPKIVVGVLDPNEKVAGRGIQKLKDSGCEVTSGILEAECREHHKRFLTFHEKKRPYIILKWAQTLDGFIAPEKEKRTIDAKPYWISNSYSRQLVHQWRAEEMAILVGTNTVLEDNPKLNLRHWNGNAPLRVVLDRDLKIKQPFSVLDESQPTLIITSQTKSSLRSDNVDYEVIDFNTKLCKTICERLHKKSITSLIIEGGTQTLQTFIDAGIWDEARVFIGATSFQKGIKAPIFSSKLTSSRKITSDTLNTYRND